MHLTHIFEKHMSCDITRVDVQTGDADSKARMPLALPPIIVYPTHGFANRLRFIASVVHWIREIERNVAAESGEAGAAALREGGQVPVWVFWSASSVCTIRASDFLERTRPGAGGVWFFDAESDAKRVMETLRSVTGHPKTGLPVPYFTNNPTFVPTSSHLIGSTSQSRTTHANKIDLSRVKEWVRMCKRPGSVPPHGALSGGHLFGPNMTYMEQHRSQFYHSRIIPFLQPWVRKSIAPIRQTVVNWRLPVTQRGPLRIGIHFRHFRKKYDELDEYDFTQSSPIESFRHVLQRIRHPKRCTFLVVSNDRSSIKKICDILVHDCQVPSENINNGAASAQRTTSATDLGDRSSLSGMKQSIIDFFDLAGCDIIVSSWKSSFSFESAVVGMRPQIHPVSINTWENVPKTEPWLARMPIRHMSKRMILSRSNLPLLQSAFLI